MSDLKLLLALESHGAGIESFVECSLVSLEHADGYLGVLVASYRCHFLLFCELALYCLEVLELQLGVYYLLVFQRVYCGTALAHDVVVVEAAQHMYYGVGLTYVA